MTGALLVCLLIAAPAQEAKQTAGRHLNEGNHLFTAGEYSKALTAFQAAYDAYPSPKIFYNFARTLAKLDRKVEAIAMYARFMEEAGLVPMDKRYQKAKAARDELLEEVGSLQIRTNIDAATVQVDGGRPTPTSEDVVYVMPGRHTAVVVAPDERRIERHVEVRPGETALVEAQFEMTGPPPGPKVVATTTPPPKEDESITGKWWFWTIIAGVAVAGASVGIGVAVSGGSYEPAGELGASSTTEWERL